MTAECEWRPSAETLRVLSQVGYAKDRIREAVAEYAAGHDKTPVFYTLTDAAFTQYIRTRDVRTTVDIDRKYGKPMLWSPSDNQLVQLNDAGYWNTLIGDALIRFLSLKHNPMIVVSAFALFRHFLREEVPITDVIDGWCPSDLLVSHIASQTGMTSNAILLRVPSFVDTLRLHSVTNPENVAKIFTEFVAENAVGKIP